MKTSTIWTLVVSLAVLSGCAIRRDDYPGSWTPPVESTNATCKEIEGIYSNRGEKAEDADYEPGRTGLSGYLERKGLLRKKDPPIPAEFADLIFNLMYESTAFREAITSVKIERKEASAELEIIAYAGDEIRLQKTLAQGAGYTCKNGELVLSRTFYPPFTGGPFLGTFNTVKMYRAEDQFLILESDDRGLAVLAPIAIFGAWRVSLSKFPLLKTAPSK